MIVTRVTGRVPDCDSCLTNASAVSVAFGRFTLYICHTCLRELLGKLK